MKWTMLSKSFRFIVSFIYMNNFEAPKYSKFLTPNP